MALNQPSKLKPYDSLRVTLENGYQHLGNEAFLDIMLFMKKCLFWIFIQAVEFCRNLFVSPCTYNYIYMYV